MQIQQLVRDVNPAVRIDADQVRIANIQAAARAIADIQEERGADGAFDAIFDCYDAALPEAGGLTPALETCMAQDIVFSFVTADLYSRFSPELRRKMDAPEPNAVVDAMARRMLAIFERLHLPFSEADTFRRLVVDHGMPAFQENWNLLGPPVEGSE